MKIINNFDSLGELIDRCNQQGVWKRNTMHTEQISDYWTKFSGVKSFDDALGLAVFGWTDGLNKIVSAMAQLPAKPARLQSREMAIAGAFPDVAAYCAGEPAYMVNLGNQENAQAPIIRLLVNSVCGWKVGAESIINRGAAIASIIDALEQAGQRVELVACSKSQRDGKSITNKVTIKRAEDPLELDKIVFCLAHPSFGRRLLLRLTEQRKELDKSAWDQYGGAIDFEASDLEQGEIYFPFIKESGHDTPNQSRQTIKCQLENQGVRIDFNA